MTQEQLRMQMLAGIITEGEYKAKLNEMNRFEKSSPEDKQAAQMFASWAKSQRQKQGDITFGSPFQIKYSIKKLADKGFLTKDLVDTWEATEPMLFKGLQVQLNRANMSLPWETISNTPRSYNVSDKDIINASPEEISQVIDVLLDRKEFDLIKRIQSLRPDTINENED
jgi:hypothetical protein